MTSENISDQKLYELYEAVEEWREEEDNDGLLAEERDAFRRCADQVVDILEE